MKEKGVGKAVDQTPLVPLRVCCLREASDAGIVEGCEAAAEEAEEEEDGLRKGGRGGKGRVGAEGAEVEPILG